MRHLSAILAVIVLMSAVPQPASASYLFPYLPDHFTVGLPVSGFWEFDLSETLSDIDASDPRAARYQFSRTNPSNLFSIEIADSMFASTTQQLTWPSNTTGDHGVNVCECDGEDILSIHSLGDEASFPYITDFPTWDSQRYGGLSTTMRFANGTFADDSLPIWSDLGGAVRGQGHVYGISPRSATGGWFAWEIYFDLNQVISSSVTDAIWRGNFSGVVSLVRQTEMLPVPDPTGLHLPDTEHRAALHPGARGTRVVKAT